MDEEYQRMAANSIAHEAFCAGQAWQQAAAAQERPCVLWKPSLFRDGNQWCALLGENIQDGVVGFGDSPDAAMLAFDAAWREKLAPAPSAQPAPIVRPAALYPVISWLRNGCDPMKAADELEILTAAPEAKP